MSKELHDHPLGESITQICALFLDQFSGKTVEVLLIPDETGTPVASFNLYQLGLFKAQLFLQLLSRR